mgnify:CR=1 FL=1
MAFRTVVIDSHSKLEYSLSYLVFRTPETVKKILLDEIHTVIISSTLVSLTTSLINELIKRKIKVIFCDEKHNPCCELSPCYGNNNSPKRIKEQISWSNDVADLVWKTITERKILNQSLFLKEREFAEFSELLSDFCNNVLPGDSTNREGHAAKVYFNHVFYEGFTRDKDCFMNACLDYGYSILLSEFNRAVVASGYLTQLGIHHKNEFNEFNLSCDFVEPFRFLVDKKAHSLKEGDDYKSEMISLLGVDVKQLGKKQSLTNAIAIYCNSLFTALNTGDVSKIAFIDYENGE